MNLLEVIDYYQEILKVKDRATADKEMVNLGVAKPIIKAIAGCFHDDGTKVEADTTS